MLSLGVTEAACCFFVFFNGGRARPRSAFSVVQSGGDIFIGTELYGVKKKPVIERGESPTGFRCRHLKRYFQHV